MTGTHAAGSGPAGAPAPPAPRPPRNPRMLGAALQGLDQPASGVGSALRHQQRRQPGTDRQPDQRRHAPLPTARVLAAMQLPLHPRERSLGAAPDLRSLPPTTSRVRAPSAGANSSAAPAPTARARRPAPGYRRRPRRGRRSRSNCSKSVRIWSSTLKRRSRFMSGGPRPSRKVQRCPRRGREHRHRGASRRRQSTRRSGMTSVR